jgi:hypothetical protein
MIFSMCASLTELCQLGSPKSRGFGFSAAAPGPFPSPPAP